jgi:hypothetical protein
MRATRQDIAPLSKQSKGLRVEFMAADQWVFAAAASGQDDAWD